MINKKLSFIKVYKTASSEERFELMMDKLDVFETEVIKAENQIKYEIKSERDRLRAHSNEELLTKVKTSTLGDRTANEAITNVMIREAVKSGKIDKSIINGIPNAKDIEEDIRTLRIMIMDHDLLLEMIECLNDADLDLIRKHYIEKLMYKEIACKGQSSESIRKRIKRICRQLKEEILFYFEMNR
jgi:hypothetical protein